MNTNMHKSELLIKVLRGFSIFQQIFPYKRHPAGARRKANLPAANGWK